MCASTVDTAAGRITTRRPGNSEVTPEIAAAMAAERAGWDTARRIDTSGAVEDSAREALDAWHRAS
jgi:predicted kinase